MHWWPATIRTLHASCWRRCKVWTSVSNCSVGHSFGNACCRHSMWRWSMRWYRPRVRCTLICCWPYSLRWDKWTLHSCTTVSCRWAMRPMRKWCKTFAWPWTCQRSRRKCHCSSRTHGTPSFRSDSIRWLFFFFRVYFCDKNLLFFLNRNPYKILVYIAIFRIKFQWVQVFVFLVPKWKNNNPLLRHRAFRNKINIYQYAFSNVVVKNNYIGLKNKLILLIEME